MYPELFSSRVLFSPLGPGNSGQRVIPDFFSIINHLITIAQIASEQTSFGILLLFFFDDSKGCLNLEVIRILYSL